MSEALKSNNLTRTVEHTCRTIVHHIKKATGDVIDIHQMTLFFKVDCKFRLWLLLCTSLKFKQKGLPVGENSAGVGLSKKSIQLRIVDEEIEHDQKVIEEDVKIVRNEKCLFNICSINSVQRICSICYSSFGSL